MTETEKTEILKLAAAQVAALRESRAADAAFRARESVSIGRDPFARSLAEFRANMVPFHAACDAANKKVREADAAMASFLWALSTPATASQQEAA